MEDTLVSEPVTFKLKFYSNKKSSQENVRGKNITGGGNGWREGAKGRESKRLARVSSLRAIRPG